MATKKGSNYGELLDQISKKQFKPIYLLQGEEPWFIDRLEEAFRTHTLEEHERDFNLTVLYGKDTSFEQIINAAKRFPMMSERQLIIVREAQDLDD
jgi:DNA polymerase-3 subunit delta